jgi:hypothetical protein
MKYEIEARNCVALYELEGEQPNHPREQGNCKKFQPPWNFTIIQVLLRAW